MTDFGRCLSWLYGIACIVVPVAALLVVVKLDDTTLEPATVNETGPALIQPMLSALDDTRRIPLSLQWGTAESVPAPATDGLVSQVTVKAGDTIRSGDPVLTVGTITLVATAEYLPEPVTRRSDPEATARLARLLVASGHLDDADAGWHDPRFLRALNAYQEANGLADVERFDPSWVVWLPSEPFVVHEVATDVGRPLPSVGQPLLRGPARLVSAQPNPAAGDVLVGGLGTYDLFLAGNLLATWDLELPVPLDLVAALQGRLDPSTANITVDAVLREISDVMTVPVSAVVTDDAGNTCLVDEHGRAIGVNILGSSPGALDLEPIDGVPPVRIQPAPRSSCSA